jgi:dolichol-phosphate mannosyltransferase
MTTAPASTRAHQPLCLPRRASAPVGGCAVRFAVVGALGYGVNLAVFDVLYRFGGLPSAAAASAAFAVAVVNNYLWNRSWTFRATRGSHVGQACRFLIVSLAGLGVDLLVLHVLERAGAPGTGAQAVAVLAATPVTFLGSKLWSFRTEDVTTETVHVLPPAIDGPPRVLVCLPTYDERENLEPMVQALRGVLGPRGVVLVVDDASADGTGELADRLALSDPNLAVMHRPGKSGLGRAYLDGFRYALELGAELVVQMDCDFSHDPADVPRLLAAARDADLVVGSRYVPGGSADGLPTSRKLLSRAGCAYARAVLGLRVRDLTGGFKCHRRELLERIDLDGVSSSGYGFQIETTFRESQAGARVAEIPITFRERLEGESKMSAAIAVEAFLTVPELRLAALGAALARYAWIVRWWALSRALVLGAALTVQVLGWPRAGWYPTVSERPLALLGAWDGRWYSIVARQGYLVVHGRQSDTAFFPLYPIAMRALHGLGLSYVTGGLVLANVAFLVALVALYELSRTWLDEQAARRTVVYAALFPFGFVFSMVYPEAPVLAAVALGGLFAVRGRWTACAVAAACAALLRPEGVFLVVPIVALVVQRRRELAGGDRGRALTAVLAAPIALVAMLFYDWRLVGDPLAFSHAQLAWGRWTSFDGIVRASTELYSAAVLGREWLYRDAAFCAFYVACLLLAYRARVPLSWIVAGGLLVLLPLWSGSFTSDARFGLVALPVYCGLGYLARRRWLDHLLRVGSAAALTLASATILLHWP